VKPSFYIFYGPPVIVSPLGTKIIFRYLFAHTLRLWELLWYAQKIAKDFITSQMSKKLN